MPPFAGQGRYVAITYEMMESPAWKALHGRAVRLYIEMRKHYKGRGVVGEVGRKYKDMPNMQRDDLFFFPQKEVFEIGEYGKSRLNKNTYLSDIRTLSERGFIKVFSKGTRGKMTIYQFSDGWKTWKAEQKKENHGKNEHYYESGYECV